MSIAGRRVRARHRLVAKFIGSSPARRSRFRTERDELTPWRARLGIPSAVLQRLLRRAPSGPWLSRRAIAVLEKSLSPTASVLEIGAGTSSLWFAARAGELVSIETDSGWAERIQVLLEESGRHAWQVRVCDPSDINTAIACHPDERFDVILVDSAEQSRGDRIHCLAAAAPKVRRGGLLVLDDSDRPEYDRANAILRDWQSVRVVGFRARPLAACETTFFRRPLEEIDS
jgi:precorrin-6B methylase 2